MPPLPAVPQVVKVTIPYTDLGDNAALSRIYVQYTGTAPTAAQLTTFADAVSAGWGANMISQLTPDKVQGPIQCEDLTSAISAVGGGTTSHAGTRGGLPLAAASCYMIQFQIARRYRGGKPKIFLPAGVAGDLSSTNTWSAALFASMTTAWNNFMAAVIAGWPVVGGTIKHVNVSYYQGFTVVTNPVTHRARNVPTLRGAPIVDPVVSYAHETSVASQRRRNLV